MNINNKEEEINQNNNNNKNNPVDFNWMIKISLHCEQKIIYIYIVHNMIFILFSLMIILHLIYLKLVSVMLLHFYCVLIILI